MKVVFCTPTLKRPRDEYLAALEASIPLIVAAGWDEAAAFEVGCPYISNARATLTRKALDAKADVIVYLDDDLSWEPEALLRLIETEGDVVSGLYRYKTPEEKYMGVLCTDEDDRPILRPDGCMRAKRIPGGFLKLTKFAVQRFMLGYPKLLYGEPDHYSIDLFNHGVHEGIWYGEDYAFSRNWKALGGEITVVPNLTLTHHGDQAYVGNFHDYMCRQPGGSACVDRLDATVGGMVGWHSCPTPSAGDAA